MATDLELYDAPSVPALPERLSFPEILETAKILAASGYFPTAKEAGQAAAKIMWGQDMGLTPMQAMTGIHVWLQSGTPTMQVSAKVITYLLRRHGFTWEFVQHDAEACEVEVYRHGKRLEPNVRFTKAQAAKAGLANKPVWQGYGEDMLWHRVTGRIADRFAPEIFDAATIPVMTTEQAESTYPDPRDDLVKALHATYREVYPQTDAHQYDEYRDERMDWSEDVLGREVRSWNGPIDPESLTRAEFQTLLDRATREAENALTDRILAAFGDDEVAGLSFLHQVLPGIPFDGVGDLDGKQRKAVHKALDALPPVDPDEDSTPALTRGQAAPSSSPDAASAAGADSTAPQGSEGGPVTRVGPKRQALAADESSSSEQGSVGKSVAPEIGAVGPKIGQPDVGRRPAEHHTAEVLGEVAPADGTVPAEESRSDTGPSVGPAPTKKPRIQPMENLDAGEQIDTARRCSDVHQANPFPCDWHIADTIQRREDAAKPKLAPTRKRRPTDPGKGLSIPDAIAEKQRFMDERKAQTVVEHPPADPIQAMPPTFRELFLKHFGNELEPALSAVNAHIIEWGPKYPATGDAAPWSLELLQELAADTFEKDMYR